MGAQRKRGNSCLHADTLNRAIIHYLLHDLSLLKQEQTRPHIMPGDGGVQTNYFWKNDALLITKNFSLLKTFFPFFSCFFFFYFGTECLLNRARISFCFVGTVFFLFGLSWTRCSMFSRCDNGKVRRWMHSIISVTEETKQKLSCSDNTCITQSYALRSQTDVGKSMRTERTDGRIRREKR